MSASSSARIARIVIWAVACLVARPAAATAAASGADPVPKFGIFEATFEAAGRVENPYAAVAATATFTRPDGKTWTIPAFWDGGQTWRVRISPDDVGEWSYRLESPEKGLNGQTGRFRCVESKHRGGVMPMKGRPYHFQYQDGSPCWLMGDTAWAAFAALPKEKLDRAAVFRYVDARAAQGFNYVHAMLVSSAGDEHEYENAGRNGGGRIFDSFEHETLNPGYFREVDARLRYMNDKGITCGVVLNWGYGRPGWRDFQTEEARLRYARYVAARYSAFDVVFILSGEWEDYGVDEAKEIFPRIGRAIMAADPHGRMRGIHPAVTPGQAEVFADEDWCDFGDYQQNYNEIHRRLLASRDHGKPVVNAEYAYFLRDADGNGEVDKENSETLDRIRHCAWDIAMAGGYFVTGFGTTYYGGWREPGPFDPAAAKNAPWEQDVQHVRTLFTGLPWWTLEPRDDLLAGPGTRYCLADAERLYVAYVRDADGPVRLSPGEGAGRAYTVRRYDPREGTFTEPESVRDDQPVELTPPDERDWLFVVARADGAK